MPSKKETIKIKTSTGSVTIERTDRIAVITEDRKVQALGYNLKVRTEITKTAHTCAHFAFSPEELLRTTYNY